MMNTNQVNILLFKKIEKRLKSKRILSASYEAETLVTHFGQMNRLDFLTGQKTLSSQQEKVLEKAMRRRLEGNPLAHVLKKADFFGRSFHVTKDTLIPRPETEILLEEAMKAVDQKGSYSSPQVLDLGTGSGCLAVSLTLERPTCRMTALDISSKALRVATKNAAQYGVRQKVQFQKSDLFEAFGDEKKAFWDVVVSNPPYVSKDEIAELPKEVRLEPRLALDGGLRGLELIELILNQAFLYLKKGGWLLMEIGKGQDKWIEKKLTHSNHYKNWKFVKDYSGIKRVLVAQNG